MTSAVQIANLALTQLGVTPITSFDDATVEAELCSQYYPVIRDAVLEDHNWSFATRRVALTPIAEKPVFQYTQIFPLPADTLRVLLVSSDAGTNFTRPQNVVYSVEGRNILANYDVIYVMLIARVIETASFSPTFVNALATRLASEMCIALTNSRQLSGQLFDSYGYKLAIAARSDGMQGSSQRMPPGSLVMAR